MDYTFPVPTVQTGEIEPESMSDSDSAVSQAIERYFQSYSPETVKAYKCDLKTWWDFCHKSFKETNDQDILKYIQHLDDSGYSNRTINRKIASLSKVMSVYVSMGLTDRNPILTLSKTTRLYRPVNVEAKFNVTIHDVEAVIKLARPRTALIVKFLVNTGLRISELINITKSDLEAFNTEFMRIRILGKGKKLRFIFIPYDLYQEIKDVFDSESLYLFSSRTENKLSRTNLYRQVRRAFNQFAMKDSVTCHSLRHFFATEKIAKEGKDYKAVSRYLGHANVSTTLDLYTHSQLEPEETQII